MRPVVGIALSLDDVRPLIQSALDEDVGSGDRTTEVLVPSSAAADAAYVAKEPIVVSGLTVAAEAVRMCDPSAVFSPEVVDGQFVDPGTVLARIEGRAATILTAERTSLNFLQRMSGIATLTRRYVQAVEGTRAVIVDTRKTVPGHRLLDKYAVACGGGVNHRVGLFDAILIKNNHLEFQPTPCAATRAARSVVGPDFWVEIEVRDMAELESALEADPDCILLDNFTPAEVRDAVGRVSGAVPLEASGGIDLDSVRAFAEAGVDRISVGALTHSVRAADIHLRVTPRP
jgi:nicotinate-nucleotide pyrophosphorylase (carboxylating)